MTTPTTINPPGVDPGDATRLTDIQIAQLAVNAGIPQGNSLATAVAIALAESAGDYANINTKNPDGSTDYGLWQINTINNNLMPGANRLDPNVNAQLMAQLSSGGTNWSPWVAYNTGAYLAFLPKVTADLAGQTFTPGTSVVPNTLGGGAGVAATQAGLSFGSLGKLTSFLTSSTAWMRIGKTVVGMALVILCTAMILKDTRAGKAVESTAMAVATKGVV